MSDPEWYQNLFRGAQAHLTTEIALGKLQERRVELAREGLTQARLAWANDVAGGGNDLARQIPWQHWHWFEHDGTAKWCCYGGARIPEALMELPEVVRVVGAPVSDILNGVEVVCNPGDTGEALVEHWRKGMQIRADLAGQQS